MLTFVLACTAPAPEAPPEPELGCEGFVIPERPDTSACDEVDAGDPTALRACLVGSGHAGLWRVDEHGLPAYQLTVDHRCDPAGQHWSPRPRPQGNPIHALGNGRGLMAMARSSGAVELYSQDRGHQWFSREDDWIDPEDETWPVQLGGGFSWVVDQRTVRSTRFSDLGTDVASHQQLRMLGMGYHRTVTTLDDGLLVDRVTYAPDDEARALVADVTVTSTDWRRREVGLVEVWDVNRHQLQVALLTSDLASDGLTDNIERQRRELQRGTVDTLSWRASERVAVVHTATTEPTVADRSVPSQVDQFPDDLYLAVLSDDLPDAVWLADDELWPEGPERAVPAAAAGEGSADDRVITRDGWGQHGFLAVRVPIVLEGTGSHTVRFAFGFAPGGADPSAAVQELRDAGPALTERTLAGWRDRVVWAAFPGLPDAAPLQRELAWSTYNLLAATAFDELRGLRFVGQGGSYRFIHGIDGAIGDFALFTEPLPFVDPELASEALRFSLAQQRGPSREDAGRYPYATTGVGTYSDVGLYTERSDVYELLPWKVASAVAETRDVGLWEQEVPYWPPDGGERGTVLDHLRRTQDFLEEDLGFGSGGMIAMGTGDYADGVLNLTDEPTSPDHTSSTYNAAFAVNGFPLLADVLEPVDPELSARVRAVADGQRQAYQDAWLGEQYARGFADNGEPMAPELLFVEPQVLAILGGLADAERSDALLDLVEDRLETTLGAVSTAPLEDTEPVGGVDQPQIGGVWPVANAWLTEAYARRDPERGWDSLVRNTLFRHAEVFPDLWYGIWTGPDSFYGPEADRPGEADAHLATALTDYPALNAHLHASPLRALQGVLGVRGTAAGLTVDPHVPTETFDVRWPRFELWSRPDGIGGSWTPVGGGSAELRVTLPSGLRGADLVAEVDGAPVEVSVDGAVATFSLPLRAGEPTGFLLRSR